MATTGHKIVGRIRVRGRVQMTRPLSPKGNFYMVGNNYAENAQQLGTFLYTVKWALQTHNSIPLGVYAYPVSQSDYANPFFQPPASMGGDPIIGFTLNRTSTIDEVVNGFVGGGFKLNFFRSNLFNNELYVQGGSPGYFGMVSDSRTQGYAIYNTQTNALMPEFFYPPQGGPRTDYTSEPLSPDYTSQPYVPANLSKTYSYTGIRG